MNKKLVSNLVDGEFTPIPYSTPRFETKVDTLKDLAKFKTKKSKNFIYNIKESWVFPEDKLDNVKDKWEDKKFFPRKYNKETERWEGGYKPELEGAITNDKGRVVYDENGKIKREPSIIQKGWEKIKPFVSPLSGLTGKSQTPLPPTPGIDAQQFAKANQNITPSGLTHTENALLSNEEKAMRLRQRGTA